MPLLARAIALLYLLLSLAGCATAPGADGVLVDPTYKPRPALKPVETPAPSPQIAAPVRGGPVDIYVIPLEDFPPAAAAALAKRMDTEFNLHTRVTAPLDGGKLVPHNLSQFYGEDILHLAADTIRALPDRGEKTIYILYTKRDLNGRDSKTRFLFAQSFVDWRLSVISSHRLYWDYRWVTPSETLTGRIWKMSKRAVGEHYYRLPRSSEVQDIMYAPLLSPDDIDKIGNDFRPAAKP